jgi:hypothetical protein
MPDRLGQEGLSSSSGCRGCSWGGGGVGVCQHRVVVVHQLLSVKTWSATPNSNNQCGGGWVLYWWGKEGHGSFEGTVW